MDGNICEKIRLVDNILQAEDFVRLRRFWHWGQK